MKTIVVISDTHGQNLKPIESIMNEADYVFFLGDGIKDFMPFCETLGEKLYVVDGNCDFGFSGINEQIVEVEGKRILLTHGHLFGVKSQLDSLCTYAKKLDCDVALYGHSHRCNIEEKDGVLMINPGSVCKMSAEKSFCYLVINKDKAVATINKKYFN